MLNLSVLLHIFFVFYFLTDHSFSSFSFFLKSALPLFTLLNFLFNFILANCPYVFQTISIIFLAVTTTCSFTYDEALSLQMSLNKEKRNLFSNSLFFSFLIKKMMKSFIQNVYLWFMLIFYSVNFTVFN